MIALTAANGTGKLATAHAYNWRSADFCVAPYEVRQDMAYDPAMGVFPQRPRRCFTAARSSRGCSRTSTPAPAGSPPRPIRPAAREACSLHERLHRPKMIVDPRTGELVGGPDYKAVIEVLFVVKEQDPSKLNGPMDMPLVTPAQKN